MSCENLIWNKKCENKATWSAGSTKENNVHLCDECVKLSKYRYLKKRPLDEMEKQGRLR